jgi:hypothetical protein
MLAAAGRQNSTLPEAPGRNRICSGEFMVAGLA